MTGLELHHELRALHAVSEPSVDRVVAGNPNVTIDGIAVVWTPTWDALREAQRRSCNVVVAHEPTYFAHLESDGFDVEFPKLPPAARRSVEETREAKRRWIEANAMVVIRCHDVLDAMPGGVVDSLAKALGFTERDYLKSDDRHRVVRIEPAVEARVVAQRLAEAFGTVGQPGVAFYGDPMRSVGSLGLGTGYACEPWNFVELGAQMAVTIDDRIKTWTESEWADDSGYPLVVIHHGTSEEWGVRTLHGLLARRHPAIRVELIEQGFRARWFSARR